MEKKNNKKGLIALAVVLVLVGDDDRGEVAQPLQVREVARVDEDALAAGLDEEAGVAEVGDLHTVDRMPPACRWPGGTYAWGPWSSSTACVPGTT